MVGSEAEGSFKPALLVVDMQEDFCPPVSSDNPEMLEHSHDLVERLVGSSWWPRDCASYQRPLVVTFRLEDRNPRLPPMGSYIL